MARYIDADALLENLKKQYGEDLGWQCTINMSDVGMMIEDAPTADVVPRSEVERVYYNLQAVLEERAETKQEIAREIFEEIDGITDLFAKRLIGEFGMCDQFAELKKKYTEEK